MSKIYLYTQAAGRAAVYAVCITLGLIILAVIIELTGGSPFKGSHVFTMGLGVFIGAWPLIIEKMEREENPKVTNIYLSLNRNGEVYETQPPAEGA